MDLSELLSLVIDSHPQSLEATVILAVVFRIVRHQA